jgi:hypothetical protein
MSQCLNYFIKFKVRPTKERLKDIGNMLLSSIDVGRFDACVDGEYLPEKILELEGDYYLISTSLTYHKCFIEPHFIIRLLLALDDVVEVCENTDMVETRAIGWRVDLKYADNLLSMYIESLKTNPKQG